MFLNPKMKNQHRGVRKLPSAKASSPLAVNVMAKEKKRDEASEQAAKEKTKKAVSREIKEKENLPKEKESAPANQDIIPPEVVEKAKEIASQAADKGKEIASAAVTKGKEIADAAIKKGAEIITTSPTTHARKAAGYITEKGIEFEAAMHGVTEKELQEAKEKGSYREILARIKEEKLRRIEQKKAEMALKKLEAETKKEELAARKLVAETEGAEVLAKRREQLIEKEEGRYIGKFGFTNFGEHPIYLAKPGELKEMRERILPRGGSRIRESILASREKLYTAKQSLLSMPRSNIIPQKQGGISPQGTSVRLPTLRLGSGKIIVKKLPWMRQEQ
jgi:hypothetical protein